MLYTSTDKISDSVDANRQTVTGTRLPQLHAVSWATSKIATAMKYGRLIRLRHRQ